MPMPRPAGGAPRVVGWEDPSPWPDERPSVKIAKVSTVALDLPPSQPKTPARRGSWNDTAPRGLPANKDDAFPPGLPVDTPGVAGEAVWVSVTAEDGSGAWTGAASGVPSPRSWKTTWIL
jgi:hypothetical protein